MSDLPRLKIMADLNDTIPNSHTLRMRYDEGGAVEVWFTDSHSVRVKAGVDHTEVCAAFAGIANG